MPLAWRCLPPLLFGPLHLQLPRSTSCSFATLALEYRLTTIASSTCHVSFIRYASPRETEALSSFFGPLTIWQQTLCPSSVPNCHQKSRFRLLLELKYQICLTLGSKLSSFLDVPQAWDTWSANYLGVFEMTLHFADQRNSYKKTPQFKYWPVAFQAVNDREDSSL